MRNYLKFLAIPVIAIVAFIGLVATGASASNPCPGGGSCGASMVTHNDAAQFRVTSFWCVTSTLIDIAELRVKNNASDHQSHTFSVQVRREQPTNIALWTGSATISYGGERVWVISMSSVSQSNQPYTYVERTYDSLVQRGSLWHTLGDYPTWAQQDVGYSIPDPYTC